ncbi:MAG: AI-2E family transporter [Planctomycetaceae bacterium]
MKQLAKTTAIVLTTLVALVLLWYLRTAVVVFLLALALAAALQPIADGLVARGLKRSAALGLTYFAAIGLTISLVVASMSPLFDDVERIGTDLTETYNFLTSPAAEQNRFLLPIARILPEPETVEQSLDEGPDSSTIRMLLGFSAGVIGIGVNLAMAIVLSVYWNSDRVHFERLWLSLLSVERRSAAREVWRQINSEIGAYLRSEFVQAVAAGILLYVGARFFDQPYPMLLAAIGAVAWMIPWLGGLITLLAVIVLWIPSVILGTAPSLWMTVAPMAFYTVALLSFLEFGLEPKLFDRRRYNPLLIVLISVGLADVIGFGGFLIGPPLASAIQIAVSRITLAAASAERAKLTQPTVPLADRLAHLEETIAGLPEATPQVASLVHRLNTLLHDAKHVTPAVVVGAPPER